LVEGVLISECRKEGVLILSGGLTVHNLRNMASFFEDTAGPLPKQFDQALLDAVSVTDVRAFLHFPSCSQPHDYDSRLHANKPS
jgi:aromatic ring-opening dioxygenase catalytic subunit (LigB family)